MCALIAVRSSWLSDDKDARSAQSRLIELFEGDDVACQLFFFGHFDNPRRS